MFALLIMNFELFEWNIVFPPFADKSEQVYFFMSLTVFLCNTKLSAHAY